MRKLFLAAIAALYCSSVFAPTAEAQTIPLLSLPQMNGSQPGSYYSMSNYNDSIFLIEMFKFRCRYCNYNVPNVKSVAQHYANNPRVQVLDIGIDRNPSLYQMWIQKHSPSFPVLMDQYQTIFNAVGGTGVPHTIVVDCNGTVHLSNSGMWQAGYDFYIKQKIDSLLALDNCQ